MTNRWPKLEILIVFGILALATFFRLSFFPAIPPGLYPDEAANGNNAVEALRTGDLKIFYPENNGREGLFINLQAMTIKLFGAEPWTLRLVSVIFGTLTVLGIYLLTKELFASGGEVPLAALDRRAGTVPEQSEGERGGRGSSKSSETGRSAPQMRLASGLGILNVREGTAAPLVAFLSAFFLATSYWHINFSRIGFRAILVPFLATFGLYWLLKALRTEKISSSVLGGIATGLGFHTYIAFRFMPFVLAIPLLFSLIQWRRNKSHGRAADPVRDPREGERAWSPTAVGGASPSGSTGHLAGVAKRVENGTAARPTLHCIPCVVALFLFITLVTALPIGLHFLNHPQDFLGRGTQVSIFSAQSPIKEFIKSTALTLGMFNFRGDCNQRHNLQCEPQLFWPVGILFVIGFVVALARVAALKTLKATSPDARRFAVGERPVSGHGSPRSGESEELWRVQKSSLGILGRFSQAQPELTLLAWFLFMMFPATLTREGLPHALRAIGLIPPVMIFAGLGGAWLWYFLGYEIRNGTNIQNRFRNFVNNSYCVALLAVLFLLWIPINTYRDYFIRFAYAEKTQGAFAADLWRQGQYLASLPDDVQKFVVVNLAGDDIRGVPAPAQTVMFATDTFDAGRRSRKNLHYVREITEIQIPTGEEAIIVPMNPRDGALLGELRAKYPFLRTRMLGDFLTLER